MSRRHARGGGKGDLMQIIPDPTFATMMAIPFVVTLVALHLILYRPLMAYLEGREAATSGARDSASDTLARVEAASADLKQRLADARAQVAEVRQNHRQAGLDTEKKTVDAARAAADAEMTEALQTLEAEATAARQAVTETADELSRDIASRVLGRAVAG
ncbi:MAG: ATP synthase F0 subunit B [Myxococcota bacterium]